MMEYSDIETNNSPYRIFKMINGDDVLCKILYEYSDAFIVECPMAVTKQRVYDYKNTNQIVEQTGLQRWIGFTNDVKFTILKEKILGSANLSQEVQLYYKMLASKVIEESYEDSSLEEDDVIMQLRENMEKLNDLLEVKKKNELEEEDLTLDLDYHEKKILH